MIEKWLNTTVADSTGFSQVELMHNDSRPDLFQVFLKKEADQLPPAEIVTDKILKAYIRMKSKADRRNKRRKKGIHKWEPQLGDLVLSKCQPVSEAVKGVTSKFMRPFEGPWRISRVVPPSAFEISSLEEKIRGIFNKEALKPYLQAAI
jgi:hypothetical protein